MRILIGHKFYHPGGGDSKYALEQERLLANRGFQVAFYSMHHPRNRENPWSAYWPSNVDYSRPEWSNILKKVSRPLYSREVKQSFHLIIRDFAPDLLHVHGIHSQLSPLIVQMAHNHGIPVVWTLHDYKLLCPAYTCLKQGEICEECFSRSTRVIRHRCLKGSLAASILAYLESRFWSLQRLAGYTEKFIAPSRFLKDKMLENGIPGDQVAVVPNFIRQENIRNSTASKKKQYCYLGRLSREKGLETLLRAASRLPDYPLKIIGDGPLRDELVRKYGGLKQVEFLGYQHWTNIRRIVAESCCTVVPSEWYENNPLSIIESFALGTPVIGAAIGGIPELVKDEETGLTFQAGDAGDLAEKIKKIMQSDQLAFMARQSINFVRENLNQEVHLQRLMEIYREVSGK